MKKSPATNRTIELIGSLGSWLIPFIVYITTIAPCVTAGDAGGFIVSVFRFSLPQSPGYPLYMLLLKFWSVLPIGLGPDPLAFKANLFSVVAMTLMCGFFYKLARNLTGSAAAALAATLTLAFSRTLWKFAVVTEIHALSLLLIVIVLLGLSIARDGKRPIGLVISAFASGLGLAHSHYILFLLPMLIFLWPRGAFKKVPVFWITVGFILPLAFYALIPVMASNTPRFAETGFTAGNFVDTITRADEVQNVAAMDVPPDEAIRPINVLARTLKYFPRQFSWLILPFCVIGWFFAPAGKRLWAFWSAITAIIFILGVAWLTRGSPLGMPFRYIRMVDELLLPVNIFLALGLGWLLAPIALALEARRDLAGTEGQNYIQPQYIPIAIMFLLCVIPFMLAMSNSKFSNMTHHTYAQDQAWNYLMQTPEDGVLVVRDFESGVFEYWQEVRKYRTDVTVEVYPLSYSHDDVAQDPIESLKEFITYRLGDRECLFTFSEAQEAVNELSPPKALRLDGIALTLVERGPDNEAFMIGDPNIWLTYQLRNLDPGTLRGIVPDDFEYEVFDRYINGLSGAVIWLRESGFEADPTYNALLDMLKELTDTLARTDYLNVPE
jgi:hypothetical protein